MGANSSFYWICCRNCPGQQLSYTDVCNYHTFDTESDIENESAVISPVVNAMSFSDRITTTNTFNQIAKEDLDRFLRVLKDNLCLLNSSNIWDLISQYIEENTEAKHQSMLLEMLRFAIKSGFSDDKLKRLDYF